LLKTKFKLDVFSLTWLLSNSAIIFNPRKIAKSHSLLSPGPDTFSGTLQPDLEIRQTAPHSNRINF